MFGVISRLYGIVTPALIERLPDTDSEGSRRSVLIYEDSSEEETDVYSRA